MGVDALGNPVRFILTAGNVNDIVQAEDLIGGLSFDKLLADKGYDSDRFRASIARQGAEAVILQDPNFPADPFAPDSGAAAGAHRGASREGPVGPEGP